MICEGDALAEAGPGVRFRIDANAEGEKGFAVRFAGKVRAYVNRCPHTGVELDWVPGEFFEESRLYLICSMHGAIFEPDTGLCIAGPCRGASLEALPIGEKGGQVVLRAPPAPDGDDSARIAGPQDKEKTDTP